MSRKMSFLVILSSAMPEKTGKISVLPGFSKIEHSGGSAVAAYRTVMVVQGLLDLDGRNSQKYLHQT